LSPFRCEPCGFRFLGLFFVTGIKQKARREEIYEEQLQGAPAKLLNDSGKPLAGPTGKIQAA
jgi:hypothetical protein